MRLPDLLIAATGRAADAPALIDRTGAHSYRTLRDTAAGVAQQCRHLGVLPGDRVLIALENGLPMVAVYFGVMMAGAVAVPMPPGPKSDRLPAAVDDCQPALAVIDAGAARAFGAGSLASVPHVLVAGAGAVGGFRLLDLTPGEWPPPFDVSTDDQDLAAIVYTSGSTGEPRGVMLSHRNLVSNAAAIVEYLHLTASDRVLCVLPFSYVYGLSLLHTHVMVGGSIVLENRTAFPNVMLDALGRYAVTGFAGVPSTFALLMHRSALDSTPLPALRYVTQAGGAMAPAMIREWLDRGPRAEFYVMYGATEAAARLTYLPPAELVRKLGSIGRPIAGVDIRVITEDGRPASIGEIGELVASGSNISRGYWQRPAETAERFGPDGYRTGDLGYRDAEGFLFLTGRRHDMIKVGANRVGAREIEDVLHEQADVREAAVVAAPDDLLGEVPVAFVALRAEATATPDALRAHCAVRLASYKVPTRVVVLDELPKLPGTGKIARAVLVRAATDPGRDAEAR